MSCMDNARPKVWWFVVAIAPLAFLVVFCIGLLIYRKPESTWEVLANVASVLLLNVTVYGVAIYSYIANRRKMGAEAPAVAEKQ